MSSQTVTQLCRNCAFKTGNVMKKVVFGQHSNTKYQSFVSLFNSKMNLMASVLAQQCNWIGALRLRRTYQALKLYQRVYGDQLFKLNLLKNLRSSRKGKSIFTAMSATVFNWDQERISDEQMKSLENEIAEVIKLKESMNINPEPVDENLEEECPVEEASGSVWESVVDTDNFMCWRKWNAETKLFVYRILGKFDDITPRAFYNTQVDLASWNDWDKHTINVQIVDKDSDSESEVVEWHSKFPWPMAPREYVYVRRTMIDSEENIMVITNTATDHPDCPPSTKYVRVAPYDSTMVIKPFSTFDEVGFEYLMTYCDDNKANIPTVAYKWAASSGCHEFLEKLHEASKNKQQIREMPSSEKNVNYTTASQIPH